MGFALDLSNVCLFCLTVGLFCGGHFRLVLAVEGASNPPRTLPRLGEDSAPPTFCTIVVWPVRTATTSLGEAGVTAPELPLCGPVDGI